MDLLTNCVLCMKMEPGISFLLVVVASIDSGFAATKYLFHIPWACSVLHSRQKGDLIGACAIIDWNKVLVSVDNFNETVPCSVPPKKYYEVINKIYVHAGSNYMDPARAGRQLRYVQSQQATTLYVAFKSSTGNSGRWDITANPKVISPKAGVEYDTYGLAFDVGILVLKGAFLQTPYVLPMLIKGPDLAGRTGDFKRTLEASTGARRHTCVTYSWNQELNKIRYHEVTYQPDHNCLEVFCNWWLLKCWQFPVKSYLMCFKSVQYAGVCPNARGAALYCPNFNNSVLGILTTAPSCGQRHMPGVYTTLPLVIEFFEKALSTKEKPMKYEPEKIVKPYDVYSLPQRNTDYPELL